MTHTLCVLQPNKALIQPRYLLHFARSPVFLDFLSAKMNPNAGVPALGLGVIRQASIPVPSLAAQAHIVEELDRVQALVETLKSLQAETLEAMNALSPATLDRCFRAEV